MAVTERDDKILAMLRERESMLSTRERDLSAELATVSEELRRARAAITALDPTTPVPVATNVSMSVVGRTFPAFEFRSAVPKKPLSYPDASVQVLKSAGHPLHIKELVQGLQELGVGRDISYERFRDTLTGILGRKARKKRIFTALGNGVYGLLEWKVTGREKKAEPKAISNTDAVLAMIAEHPGLSRKDAVDMAATVIQTDSKEKRKVASTIVGQLLQKDRVVEREGGLYAAGTLGQQQLALVPNTSEIGRAQGVPAA